MAIINYPDTPSTRNGRVQTAEVGESTRHKWVNVENCEILVF